MKFMTMKEKTFAFSLQMFAGDEGGSDGDDAGGDDQDDDDESDEGGEGDEPEKRYTEADMEAAVKKRLAREKRKWQRQQNNPDKPGSGNDTGNDESSRDDPEKTEAIKKATKLEVKVACFEADVAKESVDDVAALAHAYMAADEDLDLEDAIEKVVKKYPQFKKGSADPYEDGDETRGKSWGQRQGGKGRTKTDGVEAAFLKKNPGLKI